MARKKIKYKIQYGNILLLLFAVAVIFLLIYSILRPKTATAESSETALTSVTQTITEPVDAVVTGTLTNEQTTTTAETTAVTEETETAPPPVSTDFPQSTNGWVVEKKDGICYIDGIILVNKTYPLPKDYNPGFQQEVKQAFTEMQMEAQTLGLNIWNSSDFRSYDHQTNTYNRYVMQDGQEQADTYSAHPGYSEHQTGLAIDMNSISDSFATTPEAAWVAENCHKYGFIIRYPEGKQEITGYKAESWHIRYLGIEKATMIHESGLTIEEYYGLTSVYAD